MSDKLRFRVKEHGSVKVNGLLSGIKGLTEAGRLNH